jgi:hypothetical protein
MAKSVKAVLGSVAVCGVLLLAGCGGSSSVTAESGWNPPRPSSVPDETWEAIEDPATLSNVDLFSDSPSGLGRSRDRCTLSMQS